MGTHKSESPSGAVGFCPTGGKNQWGDRDNGVRKYTAERRTRQAGDTESQ